MKTYSEIIADRLSKAGWSWGCVSAIDSEGEQSGLLTRRPDSADIAAIAAGVQAVAGVTDPGYIA